MSRNIAKNISASLKKGLEDTSYKFRLVRQAVWVKPYSFKIYSANPRKMSLDGETLLNYVISHVRGGDVVYDVGANIGLYSLSIAQHEPSAKVFAFEPNPETFLKLKANLKLNKGFSSNIKPMQLALGSTNRTDVFLLSSQHQRSSLYEYNATWGSAKIRKRVGVEVKTIDSLVEEGQIPPPQHLKIDAEGAEHLIIQGALYTLAKYSPLVYVESHGTGDGQSTDTKIRGALEPLRYRLVGEHYILCYPPDQKETGPLCTAN